MHVGLKWHLPIIVYALVGCNNSVDVISRVYSSIPFSMAIAYTVGIRDVHGFGFIHGLDWIGSDDCYVQN